MVETEELEREKLGKIRIAVEFELGEVQRALDTRKRVDQTEPQLGDLWNHKQSLKSILEEVNHQTETIEREV